MLKVLLSLLGLSMIIASPLYTSFHFLFTVPERLVATIIQFFLKCCALSFVESSLYGLRCSVSDASVWYSAMHYEIPEKKRLALQCCLVHVPTAVCSFHRTRHSPTYLRTLHRSSKGRTNDHA